MSENLLPKEYELVYRSKERKEDILSDTMGVPFQKVKQFGSNIREDWENKLILGDNLQVTKHLLKLKRDGKLKNNDGSDGFKLICIDPPFATRQEFRGGSGEQAYNDKIIGSEFVEFLRKRLVILHELLTDDGSIYVQLDYRKCHYVKVVMDEIFGEHNFRNEITWKRSAIATNASTQFRNSHDVLLLYGKSAKSIFNIQYGEYSESSKQHYNKKDDNGIFRTVPLMASGKTSGISGKPWRGVDVASRGKSGMHWLKNPEKLEKLDKEGKIYWNSEGVPELKYYLDEAKGVYVSDLWDDIDVINSMAKEYVGFPTQKPEKLLERMILSSTEEGDLVLDSFCGSGTTLAVAEKLRRRWVGIDSSKFAIYTCIKRMLSLKKEIRNSGKELRPKCFGLYNAGLYIDGKYLQNLTDEEYKEFSLQLFQAEPMKFEMNGFEMEGILMNSPVHIFPRDGSLTEEYIENLAKEIGNYLKERIFIIVPANRVYFLQDYIEIKGTRYYVLRIPYSIIDELHKKKFVRPLQPAKEDDMNRTIDAVGFDFILPPNVEAEYRRIASKNKLIEELEIGIKKFESVQRTKNPIEFKDKESLSMVLVDRSYNGEYFNMTDYFFADIIRENGWKVTIPYMENIRKIMIIYLDILGNERIEVKDISNFKELKK